VNSFNVYRNGALQGTSTPPNDTYTDTTVVPGHAFTYEVEAVNGDVTSSRTSVTTKTAVPPLAAARLEGTFNVKATTVSESGFISFQKSFTLGWHFQPKCPSGPCEVVWKDLREKSLTSVLKRSFAKYSGSDSGDFNGRCGSSHTTTTLSISFKVTAAKALVEEWLASKFVGTLNQDSASQLGCVSSHATIHIVGTLVS
jgi:hypothetical protein